MNIRVALEVRWKVGNEPGVPLDEGFFRLLAAIEDHGSLQQAVVPAGVSYRHGWKLLRDWSARLGHPLVAQHRGQGTELAPLGRALLEAWRQTSERLDPQLSEAARSVSKSLFAAIAPRALRPIRLCVSHDVALTRGRALLSDASGVQLEIKTAGSLDSLALLARRHCDVAGFHVAHGDDLVEFVREAAGRGVHESIHVVEIADRLQGFMQRAGASTITSLADLARTGARFINRQQGSGTRFLFDRLMRETRLRPYQIRGYDNEEFTHLAVAATVAGGGAEVGFGIHAAAAEFGLHFTPLTRETYYLACAAKRADEPAIDAVLAAVRADAFRELCSSLPGYDVSRAGSSITVTL